MGFAIAAAAVSMAATGYSAYSAYKSNKQAAASSARITKLNYSQDLFNAKVSRMTAIAQANYQKKLAKFEAEMAARLYERDAVEFEAQAKNLRSSAQTEQNTGKENVRLARGDFEELKSEQRVSIAKSNVVESGTPLDVLADTAGEMEVALQSQLYDSEMKQRGYLYNAAFQDQAAAKSRYMASAGRYMGNVQARGYDMAASAARIQYTTATRAAEIARLTGMQQSGQYKQAAKASLISGASQMIGQAYNYTR